VEDRAAGAAASGHGDRLFRIVQEAITNVAKHAKARSAWIVLERHDGRLVATVEDDGQGFGPRRQRASGRGWGLLGMEERPTCWAVSWRSSPHQGGHPDIGPSAHIAER